MAWLVAAGELFALPGAAQSKTIFPPQHPNPKPDKDGTSARNIYQLVPNSAAQTNNDTSVDKHPQNIVVDRLAASERQPIRSGADEVYSQNQASGFNQQDLYLIPLKAGTLSEETLASIDRVEKKTELFQNIYFDVDSWDLKTADSKAERSSDAKLNDAEIILSQKAKQIVEALHQNKHMDIVIVGHASKTSTEDHNLYLSDKRAEAVSAYLEKAVVAIDPTLASRIHLLPTGKGDADLTVDTKSESTKNRNVSIMVVMDEPTDKGRWYRMNHLSKDNIAEFQASNSVYTFDLGMQTDIGRKLGEDFAMTMVTAARGSLLLETTDVAKPLDLKICAYSADDFRLLVNDPHAKLSYLIMNDNLVAVLDNDRTIANLHYQTADKKPLTLGDVHVASVDMNAGQVDSRTGLTMAHTVSAEGLTKLQSFYYDLGRRLDKDGNGRVDQSEMDAYAGQMMQLEKTVPLLQRASGATFLRDGGVWLEGVGSNKYVSTTAAFNKALLTLGGHSYAGGVRFDQADIADLKERSQILQVIKSGGGVIPSKGSLSLQQFMEKVDAAMNSDPSPNLPEGLLANKQGPNPSVRLLKPIQ